MYIHVIYIYMYKLWKCYELMKIAIGGGVCENAITQTHTIK
jgi:hypothetical protein